MIVKPAMYTARFRTRNPIYIRNDGRPISTHSVPGN